MNRLRHVLKTYWKPLLGSIISLVLATLIGFRVFAPKAAGVQNVSGATVMNMQSWQYVPGTERVTSSSVGLAPIDANIVNQDGSGGQPNPPVNVYGQYLKHDGGFTVAVPVAASAAGTLSVRLYSQPPVLYDEWRLETPSVEFQLSELALTINYWDGRTEQAARTQHYPVNARPTSLTITRDQAKLNVAVDNKLLAAVQATEVLDSSKLWFGARATASGWTLGALQVTRGNAAFVEGPRFDRTQPGLFAQVASKRADLSVGAAVSSYPLFSDEQYRQLALNEFNMWTTENELKAQFVQPSRGQFSFGPADAIVALANKNGITLHGHALVFGEANPAWMQQSPPSARQEIMTDHITQLVKHYAGKISEWDVVNEPLSDQDADYAGNGLRRHLWYQAMGEDYIEQAFRAARAADPTAKLYLNDYGLEADGERWDALIALLTRLKAKNVPVDGVGFQSHVYEVGDEVEQAVLTAHMNQLAGMGLLSRISELDVHGEDADAQADQYVTVLNSCLATATCTSYSTWGITDKYGSTTADHTYPPEYGNDLLWDAYFMPKKAKTALSRLFL